MLIAGSNQKCLILTAHSNQLGSFGMLIAGSNQKRPILIAHSNHCNSFPTAKYACVAAKLSWYMIVTAQRRSDDR
jgi:hypothetical protein